MSSRAGRSAIEATLIRLRSSTVMPSRLFPAERHGRADCILGIATITFCFVFFFQADLPLIGSCSLSYLFGEPLDFYENSSRVHAGNAASCAYPPSAYVLFSLWLLPFKLLGVLTGPERFPIYLTYWLKLLTTICYVATALAFRKILAEYSPNNAWIKHATLAWVAMPLGVFSQLIFSQIDIFYVFPVLLGVLMFTRKRLFAASAFFGIAMTFKYFPAFVFLPLLLFHEKSVAKLLTHGAVFLTPTILINLAYHASAAYAAAVNGYFVVDRIYSALFDVGGWHIYLLFTALTVLCGIAYVTTPTERTRLPRTAYFWLVGSVFPFLFIVWHPQWLLSTTPAIALSSALSKTGERFMLLDLAGMLAFVAVCAIAFPFNVDAAMFRGALLGMPIDNGFLMRRLFDWFSGHSLGVFVSAFSGYLLLQLILKRKQLFVEADLTGAIPSTNRYDSLRVYFYAGLLTFLVPAGIALFKDKARGEIFMGNQADIDSFARLLSAPQQDQTFIARGHVVNRVFLPLISSLDKSETGSPLGRGDAFVEIVDSNGNVLEGSKMPVTTAGDSIWQEFAFAPIRLVENATYRIRLTTWGDYTSHLHWFASTVDTYPEGHAIVDGIEQQFDFAFKVGFSGPSSTRAP